MAYKAETYVDKLKKLKSELADTPNDYPDSFKSKVVPTIKLVNAQIKELSGVAQSGNIADPLKLRDYLEKLAEDHPFSKGSNKFNEHAAMIDSLINEGVDQHSD
jgi:hypothetical protein